MIYIVYISFFAQCCRLLGEFMLSTSNNILGTCWEAFLIMEEIGIEYQVIDACSNDHIIYDGKYASKTKFWQCELRRYWADQVK